ncbi:hypothetical protein V1290_005283 [Bradyrhizobium sp. AZCC 1578]
MIMLIMIDDLITKPARTNASGELSLRSIVGKFELP